MIQSILKWRVLFFLVFIFSCKGGFFYDHSSRNFVLKFPYANYIEKKFGEFYHDFKTNAGKKNIEVVCNLYQPGIIKIEGVRLQVGHGYSIKTFFKSDHYQHVWPDTTAACNECSCAEYDTVKIARFELLKNNEVIHSYNK